MNKFIERLAAKPERLPRRGGPSPALEAAISDATTRSRTGMWTGADAAAYVGLHALCYRTLYKSLPDELLGKRKFAQAVGWTRRFIESPSRPSGQTWIAAFVKYVWQDHESKREWGANRSTVVIIKPLSYKGVFNKRMFDAWVASESR